MNSLFMKKHSSQAQSLAAEVHPDHDRLFKELLTNLFIEFLELFAPQIAAAIDRDSIEFIDKEIFSEFVWTQEFAVDVLAKVRIAGQERFILIHIENQSKKEAGFAKRMFDYFALIRAKFGLPIYPIVILSYDTPKKIERHVYIEKEFGMEVVRYQFQAIQLNRLKWQDYVGSNNPIATALMTKMQVELEDHATVRRGFYELFATGKLSVKQLRIIDEFMGSYLKLSTEQEMQVRKEMEAIMPAQVKNEYSVYMNDVETAAFARGIEQGIEQGIETGVAQGVHSGVVRTALRQLTHKFGEPEPALQAQITALPTDKLEALTEAILNFHEANAVRQWLDANA